MLQLHYTDTGLNSSGSYPYFLISSLEHEVLKVSYFDRSISIVHIALSFVWRQQFASKDYSSFTSEPID